MFHIKEQNQKNDFALFLLPQRKKNEHNAHKSADKYHKNVQTYDKIEKTH